MEQDEEQTRSSSLRPRPATVQHDTGQPNVSRPQTSQRVSTATVQTNDNQQQQQHQQPESLPKLMSSEASNESPSSLVRMLSQLSMSPPPLYQHNHLLPVHERRKPFQLMSQLMGFSLPVPSDPPTQHGSERRMKPKPITQQSQGGDFYSQLRHNWNLRNKRSRQNLPTPSSSQKEDIGLPSQSSNPRSDDVTHTKAEVSELDPSDTVCDPFNVLSWFDNLETENIDNPPPCEYDATPPETKRSQLDPFNTLLFDISEELNTGEMKKLLDLCNTLITRREREDVESPYDLFSKLVDRQLITCTDTKLLEDLLTKIGRLDLVEKLDVPGVTAHVGTTEWLITFLEDLYRKYFEDFKPIPWNLDVSMSLTKVYTGLTVTQQDKQGRLKEGDILDSESDVFMGERYEGVRARRIIIQGAPAMGKSTFCRKLANDWACGKLPQFQLLFLIEMRHVQGNLLDAVFDQLLPNEPPMSKEAFRKALQYMQKSVLFLLDGLDEYMHPAQSRCDIYDVISEKSFPWCTVVTTTRPHECDQILKSSDVHFMIQGFSSQNAIEYVDKYFTHTKQQYKGKGLITELKLTSVTDPPSHFYHRDFPQYGEEGMRVTYDLLCNPLHLSFLCLLWEEKGIVPMIMTDIYTKICDCILKRYCVKEGIPLEAGDNPPTYVKDELMKLAKLAYSLCLEGKMMIDVDQIDSTLLLSLGLLVKDTGVSKLKVRKICFFYHKTWLEYFAALHASTMIGELNSDIYSIIQRLSSPQVFIFVAGILKGKAIPLIDVLIREMQESCYNNRGDMNMLLSLLVKCLSEAKYDIKYLSPYMPERLILTKVRRNIVLGGSADVPSGNSVRECSQYGILNMERDESACQQMIYVMDCENGNDCVLHKCKWLIVHLITHNQFSSASHDWFSMITSKLTEGRLCISTLEVHLHDTKSVKLLVKAIRAGCKLKHLIVGYWYDLRTEECKQMVRYLFDSISKNKSIDTFEYSSSYFTHGDEILWILPLDLFIECGPKNLSIDLAFSWEEEDFGFDDDDSLIPTICRFIQTCKETRMLSLLFPFLGRYAPCSHIVTALKSPSPSLTGIRIEESNVRELNLFQQARKLTDVVDVLTDSKSITNGELRVYNFPEITVNVIERAKYLESLSLSFDCDDQFNFRRLIHVLKHNPVLKDFRCTIHVRISDKGLNLDCDSISTAVAAMVKQVRERKTSLASVTVSLKGSDKEILSSFKSAIMRTVTSNNVSVKEGCVHVSDYDAEGLYVQYMVQFLIS